MRPVIVETGTSPLVLGQPHGGTYVPEEISDKLNDRGRRLDDTDWHITTLYDGLAEDVTVVRATFHRYVIDANRDPSGQSLYPGHNTTTLCPTTDFDGAPIWQDGCEPDTEEIKRRLQTYHSAYHAALTAELARVKAVHGFAILYDCHSIRSHVPHLFSGQLPVFNIGTNDGKTCAPIMEQIVRRVCEGARDYDHVTNGRFKGGWTTRHYGQPSDHIHAIQMELAQRVYMKERPPWRYRDEMAAQIRPHLRDILGALSRLTLSDVGHVKGAENG